MLSTLVKVYIVSGTTWQFRDDIYGRLFIFRDS